MDLLKKEKYYWSKGRKFIGGIDEAGRGPLAGPVVASCVILNPKIDIEGIKDSKKISPKKRESLYNTIFDKSIDVGIGISYEDEIDSINILQATFLAMKRAIGNLKVQPDQILIDGPYTNIKLIPVETIVNGDSISKSIAAASIIAKVTRDRIMNDYDKIFPEFDFYKNKGYGTKYHIESLKQIKATPGHRRSFKIVKNNMPSFNHYIKSNNFALLGFQYIGYMYLKNGYTLEDKSIEIEKNGDLIDFLFKKDSSLVFVKILSIYNNKKYSNGNVVINDNAEYIYLLEDYIVKKELTIKSLFNVISVEFKHKSKPNTKIEFSAKLN